MPSQRSVWAIDIGQCALKAIRVRSVGDRIEALAHDYIEHAKILSQPDADRPALVADALKQLLDRHDLRSDRLVVAVPGQSTLSRFTKLPPVEPKKVPDIVRFEAGQQIPFDMDEVVWDWQTFRTGEAQDLEVGIFAMRRELVAEHLAPFTRAGLAPVAGARGRGMFGGILARAGMEVELAARIVTIHSAWVVDAPDADHVEIEVSCGKGCLPSFPVILATSSVASSTMVRSAEKLVSKTLAKPSFLSALICCPCTQEPTGMPNSSPRATRVAGAVWTITILPGSASAASTLAMLKVSVIAAVGHHKLHWPQWMQMKSSLTGNS